MYIVYIVYCVALALVQVDHYFYVTAISCAMMFNFGELNIYSS